MIFQSNPAILFPWKVFLPFNLITFQPLKAVPVDVTPDGTSRGLTLHETQLTHSDVLEEQKSEVYLGCL